KTAIGFRLPLGPAAFAGTAFCFRHRQLGFDTDRQIHADGGIMHQNRQTSAGHDVCRRARPYGRLTGRQLRRPLCVWVLMPAAMTTVPPSIMVTATAVMTPPMTTVMTMAASNEDDRPLSVGNRTGICTGHCGRRQGWS